MEQQTGRGKTEVITSILLLFFGIIFLFHLIPSQIEDYSTILPNAKTFPYTIGGLLVLLTLRWVYTSWKTMHLPVDVPVGFLFAGIVVGSLFAALVWLFNELGYLICGAAITTAIILFIEGLHRWKMAILAGCSTTLLFFLLFSKLLHIELPAGLFSF